MGEADVGGKEVEGFNSGPILMGAPCLQFFVAWGLQRGGEVLGRPKKCLAGFCGQTLLVLESNICGNLGGTGDAFSQGCTNRALTILMLAIEAI